MIERNYVAQTKVVAASVGYNRSDLFRYELKLTHRVAGNPSPPESLREKGGVDSTIRRFQSR